jgi:hypothetical protein
MKIPGQIFCAGNFLFSLEFSFESLNGRKEFDWMLNFIIFKTFSAMIQKSIKCEIIAD